MSIDREAEKNINQILSNVRCQSDTGQASHDTGQASHYTGQVSHYTGPARHNTGQASHYTGQASHYTGPASHNTGQASHFPSEVPMEETSQASLSESAEGTDFFYFDTEGMVCEEQGQLPPSQPSEGTSQTLGGLPPPPPPGFSNQADTSQPQPLPLMGGVASSEEATPTSGHTGSLGRMGELDKKLRDELLEAQTQNKKYMKMLVRIEHTVNSL